MQPWIMLLLTGACLLMISGSFIVIRWFVRIPIAFAWNPNSHDKMTSNVIHLLNPKHHETTHKSLLSWIVEKGADQRWFREQVIHQLRRGSVDEDMSSNIWRTWLGIVVGQTAKEGDKEKTDQTFEGTNGGYHFFNPFTNKGLSEPTEQGTEIRKGLSSKIILQLPKECMKDPMLSAYRRAMHVIEDPKIWCLDFEARNYTEIDSNDYFARGYYHLSFYTMGRVLHLLQDMAVPAHVRNDCHFNKYDDNPETLEYYADYKDAIEAGLGDKATPIIRWRFDPNIQYLPGEQLIKAKSIFDAISSDKDLSTPGLFSGLAEKTYLQHYSFGTIPGNGDSHDPNTDTEGPWYVDKLPADHFSRVTTSTGALGDVLNLIRAEIDFIFGYAKISEPFNLRALDRETMDPEDVLKFLREIEEKMKLLPHEDKIPIQKKMIWGNDIEGYKLSIECLRDIRKRWDGLDVHSLRKHLGNSGVSDFGADKGGPSDSLETLLSKWIKDHWYIKNLTKSFSKPPEYFNSKLDHPSDNPARNWNKGFHGPCCLVSNNDEVKPEKNWVSPFASEDTIIHKQYLELESHGMAYSALLLQRWFENQYLERKGIELWENKAGTDDSPPDLGAKISGGGAQIENKDKVLMENQSVHIGIAHALPLGLDLCVELELPEDKLDPEDAKIFDKGIPVQDIRLTRYEGGHEEPRVRESMKHKDGSSIEMISFGVTKLSTWKMAPFNHYRLITLQLPVTANPTLLDKKMGGIRREYVNEGLLAPIIGNLGAGNPDTTPLFDPHPLLVADEIRFLGDGWAIKVTKSSTLNYPSSVVISIILGEEKIAVQDDSPPEIAVQDDSPPEPRATIAGDDARI